MLADKYTYDVYVTKPCGEVLVVRALAGSKWEAEDRAHTKFIFQQPDRSAYTAKRSYAHVRQQVGGVL